MASLHSAARAAARAAVARGAEVAVAVRENRGIYTVVGLTGERAAAVLVSRAGGEHSLRVAAIAAAPPDEAVAAGAALGLWLSGEGELRRTAEASARCVLAGEDPDGGGRACAVVVAEMLAAGGACAHAVPERWLRGAGEAFSAVIGARLARAGVDGAAPSDDGAWRAAVLRASAGAPIALRADPARAAAFGAALLPWMAQEDGAPDMRTALLETRIDGLARWMGRGFEPGARAALAALAMLTLPPHLSVAVRLQAVDRAQAVLAARGAGPAVCEPFRDAGDMVREARSWLAGGGSLALDADARERISVVIDGGRPAVD